MSRPPITLVPALARVRFRALIATALALIYLVVHVVADEISWFAVGFSVVVDGMILWSWIRERRVPPPMPDAIPAGTRMRSAWVGALDAAAYPLFVGVLPVILRFSTTHGTVEDPSPWGGVPLFAAAFFAVIAGVGWDRARRLGRTEIAAGRRLYSGRGWKSDEEIYVEVAAPARAATRQVVSAR